MRHFKAPYALPAKRSAIRSMVLRRLELFERFERFEQCSDAQRNEA
jgi:hypothetical protein